MRELNIRFLEEFKIVDRFIKDSFGTSEGVSEYIRQMEAVTVGGHRYVKTWEADYRMLKHVRWVRNQLVHEVGYDSTLCEQGDYQFIKLFGERLCACEDPISLMAKAEKAERQRRLAAQRASQKKTDQNRTDQRKTAQRAPASGASAAGAKKTAKASKAAKETSKKSSKAASKRNAGKLTFWQKIKNFFSGD